MLLGVHPTHSAVIVPIPEAEPVVGSFRRTLDPTSAWGIPAHVSPAFPGLGCTERLAKRGRVPPGVTGTPVPEASLAPDPGPPTMINGTTLQFDLPRTTVWCRWS